MDLEKKAGLLSFGQSCKNQFWEIENRAHAQFYRNWCAENVYFLSANTGFLKMIHINNPENSLQDIAQAHRGTYKNIYTFKNIIPKAY